MIYPINQSNTTFKGFYLSSKTKFSDSQKRVINDIQEKLKDRTNDDFLFEQGNTKDSVSLNKVFDMRELGVDTEEPVNVYSTKLYIGTYDEFTPFEYKDYKSVIKKNEKNLYAQFVLWGLGIAMILFSAKYLPKSETNPYNSKENTTILKKSISDTLKSVKDTIKF